MLLTCIFFSRFYFRAFCYENGLYFTRKIIEIKFSFFRITSERLLTISNEIEELFPTVTKTNWFRPASTNSFGAAVSATGCLKDYYKTYRRNLITAKIVLTHNTSDLADTSTSSGID